MIIKRSLVKNIFLLSTYCILLFTYQPNHARLCFEERSPKFIWDMIYVNIDLFSTDSLKILALFAPLYIGSRFVDPEIHCCFYSHENHKNICQFNKKINNSMDKASMGISLGLTSLAIFASDEELRTTARVFASGLLPIWLVKNLFKTAEHCGNLRPKCEYFNRHKNYYGGCPSGHMAFITYATTVFGFQYGPSWGIPLGAVSIAVFASSCNSNRHFASQLIAGTALGVLYGWAAHKVIEDYQASWIECNLVSEPNMPLGLGFSCTF